VDLRTPADLSRYFRQEVLDAAEVVWDTVIDDLPPLVLELEKILFSEA
jgi:hypothetical protein